MGRDERRSDGAGAIAWNEERVARGLGWFSMALGAAELVAPRTLAETLGLSVPASVVAAFGLREIATGLGIFSRRRPNAWLWARVAGDALDLGVLAASLASRRGERGAAAAATMAVAGVTLLDVAVARRLGRGGRPGGSLPRDRAIRLEEVITIRRPRAECYRSWRDLENLPKFMSHLESVRVLDERRSHWVAKTPGGMRIEWDAEIVNDVPNERIAWLSLPGADVDSAGSVRFEDGAAAQFTRVRLTMNYRPPAGIVGEAIAELFGEAPQVQVREDLGRFRRLLEGGADPGVPAAAHTH